MKIPRKIRVCGHEFKIVFKRKIVDEGVACLGLCDVNKNIIYLQYGMEKQKRFETMFHEVLHALDLNKCYGLGEKRVNNLALDIIQIIKDNKIRIS